jgi:hypothetical protein
MSGFDNSIYKNFQVPDFVGGIASGLDYRDNKNRQAKQDLVADEKAKREKSQWERDRIGKDVMALDSIKDVNKRAEMWPQLRSGLEKDGVDVSQIPETYDDGYFNFARPYFIGSDKLTSQEKDRADIDYTKAQTEKIRKEANKKANTGEELPIDSKKVIENLATKNANKTSIKNQIEAVMDSWDSLSEEQQLAAGRQLLKTLNSPEGADAIGSEEANRLGSMLEFSMGNFTNSNPTQFGRNLKGFREQAKNTARNIGEGVLRNKDEINRLMGRPIAERKKDAPPPGFDLKALANIDLNNVDPGSLEALYKQAGGK